MATFLILVGLLGAGLVALGWLTFHRIPTTVWMPPSAALRTMLAGAALLTLAIPLPLIEWAT